jgi:uncharacterized protein
VPSCSRYLVVLTLFQMSNDAIRYDRATIELVESNDEFIRTRLALARPGVFTYEYPDGREVREAKLPEDLFHEDVILSAKGVPVTLDHPPGLVTKENYSEYAKGAISDPRVEDDILWADETIWAPELMEALKANRKIEVSLGIRCKLEKAPGEFNGEKYDVKQTNMVINHVAHVDKARLGSEMRTYMDSSNNLLADIAIVQDSNFSKSNNSIGVTMPKKPILDLSWIDGLKRTLSSLRKDSEGEVVETDPKKPESEVIDSEDDTPPTDPGVKKDSEEIEMLKQQITLLTDTIKGLKAMLDQALNPVTQDALAAKRHQLIEAVRSIDPETKLDGKSEKEIKLHLIGKVLPFNETVKLDSVSSDLIDSRYEAALELARQKALIGNGVSSQTRTDSTNSTEDLRSARLNVKDGK